VTSFTRVAAGLSAGLVIGALLGLGWRPRPSNEQEATTPPVASVPTSSSSPSGSLRQPAADTEVPSKSRGAASEREGAIALDLPQDQNVFEEAIWKKGCGLFPMTARLTFNGTVAGRRPRQSIWVGVQGEAFRIEPADASRSFVLTGSTRPPKATLALSSHWRVNSTDVRGLVHAVAGIPWTGRELQGLLTTCPAAGGGVGASYRTGANALDVSLDDTPGISDVIHFRRNRADSPWQLLAMTSDRQAPPLRWRTEFNVPISTVPKTVRVRGLDWRGEPDGHLDIVIAVDRVQVSPMLAASLFEPEAGPLDTPMTLEELRSSGTTLPLMLE
jgi:hypothetical protein